MLVAVVALSVLRTWPLVVTVNKEARNLQQKIDEVNRDIAEAEKTKEYLSSPTYLERQARLKLNYKKPDEKVVFVYRNPYNQRPDESVGNLEHGVSSWWQRLWLWVKAGQTRE